MNKPEHNISTVKNAGYFGILLLKYGQLTIGKSVITFVTDYYEMFTILIKLQMKVKIFSPFWSICGVFDLKFFKINNINIII